MKLSHRLLVLAAAGAFAPFMLRAAPDALAAGAALTNPGSAPRDVTLPDGTFVRLGANATGSINAAGELVLEKGSAVIIAKDGAPVTLVTGGTRTTVTGGTTLVSATKDAGLRVIAIEGETTVAADGAEPVELEAGQLTTVFTAQAGQPATTGAVVNIDLGALAKSSRLLNASPLPTAGALGEAVAGQRESLATGDLSPTGRLLVAASRERGLGFASAGDVQNALSLGGTALKAQNDGWIRFILAEAAATLANNPNNPPGNTIATGTFEINGVTTQVIADTATGSVQFGNNPTQTSGGSLSIGNNAGAGAVTVNAGSSGAITVTCGAGSLVKNGAGTLSLSGANTYTGSTTVNGGSALTLAGGAIIHPGSLTLAGGISRNTLDTSGAGSLVKDGDGTLSLSPTNTYDGSTTFTGSTLTTNSATFRNSLGNTGTLTIALPDLTTLGTATLTGALGETTISPGTLTYDDILRLTRTSLTGLNNGTLTFTNDWTITSGTANDLIYSGYTLVIADGKALTFTAPETVTVKNTNFIAATGATSGTIVVTTPRTGETDADKVASNTSVSLDAVTFAPVQSLQLNSRTISLKNVTFDRGRLLSRDGVLNIGSVVDGAVNFVSGVKTSDNTDLTTAEGINAKVQVVPGTILQNGAPMAGATGAGAGATIVIDRR